MPHREPRREFNARRPAWATGPRGKWSELDGAPGAAIVQIRKAVEQGAPLYVAAAAVGFRESAVRQWFTRGVADLAAGQVTAYALFVEEMRAAEARAEASITGWLHGFAEGEWRAAAWILERRWPERWGPKVEYRVDAAVSAQVAATWDLDALSIEQLETLLRLARTLAAATPRPAPVPLEPASNGANGHAAS